MVTYLGPKVYNGSNWMQLRHELTYFPFPITKDTSAITLVVSQYVDTGQSVSDSVNSGALTVGGSVWSGSTSISHGAGGGSTLMRTTELGVAPAYGAVTPVGVSGSLSGIEAVPGTAGISYTFDVPARPYQLPAAPSGVGATRNSDTSHTVAWTRNVSTAAPYSSQQVQRSTDGGAWATVATVAGTATSYTDTTTSADRSYAWRVVAVNSSGSTASTASTTRYTTPAAPGTPTATKSGSNIVLAFTNTARHDAGIKVYASQNGGAFALLATVATPDLTGYTHVSPSSAVTWAYRVATYNGDLISAQSAASNTVVLAAAPNAPTGLGPTTVRDATEDVTLTWQHNPVDTSGQTVFQVQHRAVGAGSWTTVTAVTSATSAWVLAGGTYANPVTVEWQVRTKGQHADYSPWSATATLPSSTRPTATIATPEDAGEIDTSVLTVTWAYYDAESTAQVAWAVELYNDTAGLVETRSGVGTATSATMATVLPDGSAWSVRVRVQDAAGLWSLWDDAAFTVAYALPPTPVLVATWDPVTATVALEVTNPGAVVDEVDTDHVEVYRSIASGPWVLIATGVPPNTTITDWTPPTVGSATYRVDAVSALPSVAPSSDVAVTTGRTRHVFISGGPGMSVVCRALSNIQIDDDPGRAKVLRQYAGRDHPVERTGQARRRTLSMSADILKVRVDKGTASSEAEWLALADLAGPHLWRDVDGRYLPVSIAVSTSRGRGGHVTRLAVTATQVDQ